MAGSTSSPANGSGGNNTSNMNMDENGSGDDNTAEEVLAATKADNANLLRAKAAYQSYINWAGFKVECISAESGLCNKMPIRGS